MSDGEDCKAKDGGVSERQLYKACASEILRWGRSERGVVGSKGRGSSG
jgi:hypothetical protein